MTSHSNDDTTTLSSSPNTIGTINETFSDATTTTNLPELQLCINDLVNPTETAETLLETLSTEQLNIIEQAVNKIKERKLLLAGGGKDQEAHISTPLVLSTVTTTTPNSPIDHSSISSSIIMEEQEKLSVPTTALTTAAVAPATTQIAQATTSTTTKVISTSLTPNTATINNEQQQQSLSQPTVTTTNKSTTNKSNNNTTTTTNSTTAKPPVNSTAIATATATSPFLSSHEPTTEIKEGVEWVSFVYSHHRTLRRYCIRTDLDQVDTSILDDKFKKENCVYPRANLPRETYRGNRWAYETECNVLGWKLAYLNLEEIAGKRGLIQRAVDSYRNRYPSMRSRRVARQEKLLKGTLRKRKNRDNENSPTVEGQPHSKSAKHDSPVMSMEKAPKTILIEDTNHTKCRIKINIESVVLDAVDLVFRKNNCVFPRSMHITSETPNVTQRRLDEVKCNEIGWKLAWLNPRQLANKKNLLQKALDTWRNQFTVDLKLRKYASRTPPSLYVPTPTPPPQPQATAEQEVTIKQEEKDQGIEMLEVKQEGEEQTTIPLTEQALEQQQKEFDALKRNRRDSIQSFYSGTTVTLDFHDYCFSPPAEEEELIIDAPTTTTEAVHTPFIDNSNNSNNNMFDELILAAAMPPMNGVAVDDVLSESTSSSSNDTSQQNTPSPAESLMNFYQHALLLNTAAAAVAAAAAVNATTTGSIGETVKGEMMDVLTDGHTVNENNTTVNIATSALVELMAKYQSVIAANAGIGGNNSNNSTSNNGGGGNFATTTTSTTSTTADPSLLNQLF